jgi:hypothetical protein
MENYYDNEFNGSRMPNLKSSVGKTKKQPYIYTMAPSKGPDDGNTF